MTNDNLSQTNNKSVDRSDFQKRNYVQNNNTNRNKSHRNIQRSNYINKSPDSSGKVFAKRPPNNQKNHRNQNNQRHIPEGLQRKPKRNNYKKVYHTSSAQDWGSRVSYQFKNDPAVSNVRITLVSGLEDVGTNCTVMQYEDDIMVIDAGMGFPPGNLPGVDGLVPNLDFLIPQKSKIRGIVITHGHSDHIGGLVWVSEKLGLPPIYAPKLAAGLIREKLKETMFGNQVRIIEIDGNSNYYLGKFHLSHFKMTHTIPDNYGIVIETPVGKILTPSDFKFDLTPYKESPSDYSKLAKLGDEGVLMMLQESTNARKRGWSASETEIAKDLEDIVRDAEGRVIIGMFSTMVNRIRQIIEIADRHHKKIAVLGRSLENAVRISHELGYINVHGSIFIPVEETKNYKSEDIVILTTGSQGESKAALMRMALGQHNRVQLHKSDTVVFSSSQIPGNEDKIQNLINLITLHGCRILLNDYLTLHASGHGNRDEHRLMLQLVKPKYILPIHGEPSMLTALRDIARELGYSDENIVMCKNGTVVEVNQSGWKIVDEIDTKPHWVEGNRVGDFDPEIVSERKALNDEGIVIITVKGIDNPEFNSAHLKISSVGFFIQKGDNFLESTLKSLLVDMIHNTHDKREEHLFSEIRKIAENELVRKYTKKPYIHLVKI